MSNRSIGISGAVSGANCYCYQKRCPCAGGTSLEVDLERKLENSRLSVGPGQSAEVRVRDTRVRKTEVGAVERIERFKPELGVAGLTQEFQREAPDERHIEIRKAGALEGVSAQVSNVWDLPGDRVSSPYLKAITRDWKLSGILTLMTGRFFGINSTGNVLAGVAGGRVDLTGTGSPILDTGRPKGQKVDAYFDKTRFQNAVRSRIAPLLVMSISTSFDAA
jgi:hypothetical protein